LGRKTNPPPPTARVARASPKNNPSKEKPPGCLLRPEGLIFSDVCSTGKRHRHDVARYANLVIAPEAEGLVFPHLGFA